MSYFPDKLLPYRTLFNNFTSLSVLQIANYIFPLIVLPYIVRVIGPSKYGLINFASAFIAYFNLICDYGFDLSGTREVSVLRNDNQKINKVFSNIITIKILLSIFCLVILLCMLYLIGIFYEDRIIILLTYGILIGSVLFPGWFYQGTERMKYITLIQVTVRIIITALIFLIIKEEEDYIILVLLNALAQITIGLTGFVIALVKFNIKFIPPSVKEIIDQIKSGWNIFQSMVAINLYTTSNVFMLGLFASETVVGYYAAADKIKQALQSILSVMSQTVFPYVNNLINKSRQSYLIFVKRFLKIQIAIGLFISLVLFVYTREITVIILGAEFSYSAILLKIISPVPFLVSISSIYGIQIMLPMGLENSFNKIISATASIHLIVLLILVPAFSAVGTSAAVVFTEFFISTIMIVFISKKRLLFYNYEI